MQVTHRFCTAVCAIALGAIVFAADTPSATLEVTVNNVRSGEGQVRVAVYVAENWLEEPVARVWTPAKEGESVTAKFTLPPGEYGVAVLHDLNDSGDMDYRLGRFPTEPYGFSNDAKPRFSAPKFKAAAFLLGDDGLAIAIELRG